MEHSPGVSYPGQKRGVNADAHDSNVNAYVYEYESDCFPEETFDLQVSLQVNRF
jgi:hypothetical protein